MDVKEFHLVKHLKIELISQKKFDSLLKKNQSPIGINENTIKKNKGVISIPTSNDTIKFIDDKPVEGFFHEYVSKIPFLNIQIVAVHHLEGSDFELIEMKTGESTTMQSLPHISPDKKWIIYAYSEFTYEEGAVLYLHSISDNKIQKKFEIVFSRWRIIGDDKEKCWISNNEFILKAHLANDDEIYKEPHQYIKITVL